MAILITGIAGFIGSHCATQFAQLGEHVIGLDNFDDYYDPAIKHQTVAHIQSQTDQIHVINGDCRDQAAIVSIIKQYDIQCIIHLAALAGVRASLKDPARYYDVNITGTVAICEAARQTGIAQLLIASSSSVYGNNKLVPFAEHHRVDHPISPYAASKKACELLAYSYHHLYQLPIACLRFFTVYGPRQRPEMAIHHFAKQIIAQQPITVYNHGHCERDYTYISDIIAGIIALYQTGFTYDIVNLGSGHTTTTQTMITTLEKHLNKKAILNLIAAQPGDVERTYADITHAQTTYHYQPQIDLDTGIAQFVETLN